MIKTLKTTISTGVFNPIKETILKVIGWFLQLGVCYLIQLLGKIEISKAFFGMQMIALILGGLIYLLFAKMPTKAKIIAYPVGLFQGLLPVLVAYIVSTIFTTFNFFEVYMLIILGKCFWFPQKKTNKMKSY